MRQMIFKWKSLRKCDILPLLERYNHKTYNSAAFSGSGSMEYEEGKIR